MQCLPFMHRASALGTTTACIGGAAKRRRLGRIDDVYDDAAGIQSLGIHGQGVVRAHTQRRGIDDDLESAWIG
ncbi:hypothetical protein ASC78_02000 [Variovorax sp. Root318D1]|nr:hypothetical protein ASC78_02000 [Variovorax sp. Root318D1]